MDNFQRKNQEEGPRNNQRNEQRKKRQEQEDCTLVDNRPIAGVINVVTGGLSFGGPGFFPRKGYAKVYTIMA